MKDDKDYEDTNTLSGCIRSIPLIIEDKETKKIIKKASLYLHCCRNGSKTENTSFTDISLTAMNQEGSFHIIITKEKCSKFKRKRDYSIGEWELIIRHLFPVDDNNEPTVADDLTTSAKLISLSFYYDPNTNELIDDDELPLISESITIDIKTKSKLPITVGSIDIPYFDAENDLDFNDKIRKEQNLFNWLDLLLFNNQNIYKELQASRQSKSALKKQNEQYKNELELSSTQHKSIVEDLLNKLYQVLNAKKDKIWELENKNLDHLEGLNEKYVTQNKFNLKHIIIDKDEIPDMLDDVYISPKKRRETTRGSTKPPRKRKKVSKKADDNKETEDIESNKEPISDPVSDTQDVGFPLISDTKELSDREIVTSVLHHDKEHASTDVDDLHESKKDDSTDFGENTDYSQDDNQDNGYNNGDNYVKTVDFIQNHLLQSGPQQSNCTAKSQSETAKRNSITDYDTDSDEDRKGAKQMPTSNTDEIEDSLQSVSKRIPSNNSSDQ